MIAAIGVIGSVLVAYFAFRGSVAPVELAISATQTAEGKLLTEAQLPAPTVMPTQTQAPAEMPTLTPTETTVPTITLTFTPTPIVIANTNNRVGWVPNFDSSNGDNSKNKTSTNENAIEVNYDVGKYGYVVITKSVNSKQLTDVAGISFTYKGVGAPNTIEFKLLLQYRDDKDDTTYGILWNRATDTGDQWLTMEILYSDMECWWPKANCKAHGSLLDPAMVDRLDFAISNKDGDDEGSGWILIKDIVGIRP